MSSIDSVTDHTGKSSVGSTMNRALSALVQYGVSDELIQQLQSIAETTDTRGLPLYDSAAVYELRCALLCRNYGKALWEYSHFVATLEYLHPQGVCDLFWGRELVTRQRLQHWFEGQLPRPGLTMGKHGTVEVRFSGRAFSLHTGRAGLMAAWTAFLALVEPDLLGHFTALKTRLDETRADELARHLKQRLDQYLDPHLQPLQQQRQGRVLLSWLQHHARHSREEREAGALLDDRSVLCFWQARAPGEEGDFRRFTTVADCAYRLHEALEMGEQRDSLQKTRSYQQDARGEDATWLLDRAVAQEQEDGDHWLLDGLLARRPEKSTEKLASPPLADIKFLTAKDSEFCMRLERAGAGALALPLTYLRAQVFGLQQSRLTEDLRKNRGQPDQALMNLEDYSGMEAWEQTLGDQTRKIQQTRDAIAHILFQHRVPDVISSLVQHLEADQKRELQRAVHSTHGDSAEGPDAAVVQQIMGLLAEYAAPVLKEQEKAFSRVNREGFKGLPAEERVDHYRQGEDCLARLSGVLNQYARQLKAHTREQGGVAAIEAADRPVFQKVFTQLYGDDGVQS